MLLYPRLPLPRARVLCAPLIGLTSEALRFSVAPTLDGARFAPTGGARVSLPELLTYRARLDELAVEAGWPYDSQAGRQRFDRSVAAWLGSVSFPPGEMLRAETWSWFTVHLVPHLVRWRFPGPVGMGTSVERFAGPIQRNLLGRLWFRGWVLDQGEASPERWSLAQAISEDAAVAILERTSLASDHRIARAIAARWFAARSNPSHNADSLLREAIKGIRVLAVVRDLSLLNDEALSVIVQSAFDAALATRGAEMLSPSVTPERDPD